MKSSFFCLKFFRFSHLLKFGLAFLFVMAALPAARADDAFNLPVAAWMSAHGTDKYGAWAEFTLDGVTQRLRWIKPGTFVMGSPEDELGHMDCETQHKVTLTQGYWMADTPCTISLWWFTVMKDGEWSRTLLGCDRATAAQSNLPVVGITYNECLAFLKSLNSKVPGLNAALPTEAQWEYACRAGSTGPYAGDLNAEAWMAENSGNKFHPVKTKAANPWGLYDMPGNVYTWCQDTFANFTADAVTDPLVTTGTARVIRGGSFYYHKGYLRSASRWGIDPNTAAYPYIGFRICVPATVNQTASQ
jgi:formylglycine-generating enzyme required for sulfatase activity